MEEVLVEGMIDIPSLIKTDDIDNIIKVLKMGRKTELPDIESLKKEYNPEEHKIFDTAYREDKIVRIPKAKTIGTFQTIKGNIGKSAAEDNETTKTVKVNRLAFPFQKRIVDSSVDFLFGFPVELISEPKNESEKLVLDTVKTVNHDNKMPSFDRKIGRDIARAKEIAEYWFVTGNADGQKHDRYGFQTPYRLKVAKFSPWEGQELYPFFDAYGDLIAFSRQFEQVDINAKRIVYFETYTADFIVLWRQGRKGWEQVGDKKVNQIKKIPIAYGYQDQSEWADAQWCIERIEFLLSNFAEIIDYHAAPKIFVEGILKGFSQKGDAGGILQGEAGSKAYYLSWNFAPEAVKLEIDTLLRFIYGFTQTPDISFDSVKGLHQISGETLKMLFMDAHLKVQKKKEIFDEYLQRRTNIQKAYVAQMNTSLKEACQSLKIEPLIKPFIVDDETTKINNISIAGGGQPFISRKTQVQRLGWVKDADAELEAIRADEEEANAHDLFEHTA